MKKRSFILCDLLKGCMQRLDYNVLTPYLQVISLSYQLVGTTALSVKPKTIAMIYSNHLNTGHVRYSNGRPLSGFRMVSTSLDRFYINFYSLCIKRSRLVDHSKTRLFCPVFEWSTSLDRFTYKMIFFLI